MLTICTRLLNSHTCPYKALFTKLCNNGRGPFEMYYHRYKKGLDWLKKSEIRKKIVISVNEPKTQILCHDYWLIDYLCFTSRSGIFHLYGDVTIAGEGLQNLSLCSKLRAYEQGGVFIVPHLLWHRTSGFPVSSERPPQSVASYGMGIRKTYSNPDPHGDCAMQLSHIRRRIELCMREIILRFYMNLWNLLFS
jgi:hypothetical protein